ncbi:YopX family protein [Paenibacillus sp. UKAQ_18]|nr:YopX family protein [Paenibacillus sp. UKAQ_18]
MSRPIKFRAWDVFEKEMDYEVTIDPDGKVAAFNPLDGQYVRGFSDDEKVIMQYTGLKDRNGKEIYEGDILKWYDRPLSWYRDPDKTSCSQIIDVAVFSNGSFRSRKYSELLINLCGTKDFNFLERSEIEVIGNIYETPLEDTP